MLLEALPNELLVSIPLYIEPVSIPLSRSLRYAPDLVTLNARLRQPGIFNTHPDTEALSRVNRRLRDACLLRVFERVSIVEFMGVLDKCLPTLLDLVMKRPHIARHVRCVFGILAQFQTLMCFTPAIFNFRIHMAQLS
jgi:hypothetical protein